jgi:(E)-4-hydroxy-3-methylbut-2-enyl-diphosphate synthase
MSQIYRSHAISIKNLKLGADFPVLVQSMTNTDTNDVLASVDQCKRIIDAGADLVRLTTQGKKEVSSLAKIKANLQSSGLDTPLVADIHFKPQLALEAARVADKIRINPGNYLKGKKVETVLPELLQTCKRVGCAIRIGVNHGSLDESILNEFGNTPAGMVESAMRFLRICKANSFDRVVVSMKSSNPVVMIQSVRLLVQQMRLEGMSYPLHLGVTEAGDGPEGRIKSTVGMAPLLLEGMGDTIRVSLTEAPEEEIPVASAIVRLFPKPAELPYDPFENLGWDPFSFVRRKSIGTMGLGNSSRVKIISPSPPEHGVDLHPDQLRNLTVTFQEWKKDSSRLAVPGKFLLLEHGTQSLQDLKSQLNEFCKTDRNTPIIFKSVYREQNAGLFSIKLAGILGSMLVDGLLDGVWIRNPLQEAHELNDLILNILQAAGARISKTEFIACPSCGRTHFDILARLKEIREATSHLKTLKIGVMGCIVNGPGEMADSHYGYVGAGPGKVTLYKGKEPRQLNLPEKEALTALISLIKQEGDWIDP